MSFWFAKSKFQFKNKSIVLKPRELNPIKGTPKVSYIIPTMMRQDFHFKSFKRFRKSNL